MYRYKMLYTFSGNLVHLVTLDVSHNNITSIPHGKSSRTIEISISFVFCNAGLINAPAFSQDFAPWVFHQISCFISLFGKFKLHGKNVLEEKN